MTAKPSKTPKKKGRGKSPTRGKHKVYASPFASRLDERRAMVARLYLEGNTQADIAETLGVTQQLISLDIKAVRAQWKADATSDFAERLETELCKLDLLFKSAYRSYLCSTKGGTHPGNDRFLLRCVEITQTKARMIGAWKGDTNLNQQVTFDFSALVGRELELPDDDPIEQRLKALRMATAIQLPPQEDSTNGTRRPATGPALSSAEDDPVGT